MKKIWGFIKFTGLWTVPLIVLMFGFIYRQLKPRDPIPNQIWFIAMITAACTVLYIWNTNDVRRKNSKKEIEEFGITDAFSTTPNVFDEDDGKEQFRRPKVPSEMLFESPDDCFYCIGSIRQNNKKWYVGIPMDIAGAKHVLISGGSGSGKSSTQILPNLINMIRAGTHAFIIDAKGELWRIVGSKQPNSICISLKDRNAYGYDPLYMLGGDSSEADVHDVMKAIVLSLIPTPAAKVGDNGPWIPLAQILATGLATYAYRKEQLLYLPRIVKWMFSAPMDELVRVATDNLEPTDLAYMDLKQFVGMSEETFFSVVATAQPKLLPFIDDSIEWAMALNPKKFQWEDLYDKSVYFVLPINEMEKYSQLVNLMINQLGRWLYSLSPAEIEAKGETVLILDEAVAIFQALKSLPNEYLQLARYGRSYGFSMVTAVQSIAGLNTIMTDAELDDFLSNSPYKVALDVVTSVDKWKEWIGKYKRKHTTYNGLGKERTRSIQFSDDDILDNNSALTLGLSQDLICVNPISGYMMVQKAPWYKDSHYKDYQ